MGIFKKQINLFFLIIFIPIIGFLQQKSIPLDLKNEKEILIDVLAKDNKGLLVISQKLSSKDLNLKFYDSSLKETWKVNIPSGDLGLIKRSFDSNELQVYFSQKYIYVIHAFVPDSPAFGLIQINYNGEVKKEKIRLGKGQLLDKFFFHDDQIHLISKKVISKFKNEIAYQQISQDNLTLTSSKTIALLDQISLWDITEVNKGLLYYYSTPKLTMKIIH